MFLDDSLTLQCSYHCPFTRLHSRKQASAVLLCKMYGICSLSLMQNDMAQLTSLQLGFLPFPNQLKRLQSAYWERPLALVVTCHSQALSGRKHVGSLNSMVSI